MVGLAMLALFQAHRFQHVLLAGGGEKDGEEARALDQPLELNNAVHFHDNGLLGAKSILKAAGKSREERGKGRGKDRGKREEDKKLDHFNLYFLTLSLPSLFPFSSPFLPLRLPYSSLTYYAIIFK
jgi:hypothetical protein